MLNIYLTHQEAQDAIDNLPDAYHRGILYVLKAKNICKKGKDGYVVQLKPFKKEKEANNVQIQRN